MRDALVPQGAVGELSFRVAKRGERYVIRNLQGTIAPDWCPIPPGENWLRVPIRAGERNFPGANEIPGVG